MKEERNYEKQNKQINPPPTKEILESWELQCLNVFCSETNKYKKIFNLFIYY